jgi:hypothetical protein
MHRRDAYRILVRKLEETALEDLNIDGRIILRWTLMK